MTPSITALNVCKRAQDAANTGELSQFALNELMRHVADTHFGGSMAKMLEIDAMGRPKNHFGQIFLAPKPTHTVAAEQAELHKREGLGRSDGSTGGMSREDNSGGRDMTAAALNDDDDEDADKDVHTSTNRRDTGPRQQRFTDKVAHLMKSDGLSFDQACTAVIMVTVRPDGFASPLFD
jgi:hypothetical protein